MKQVLVISSTMRKGGNSEALARRFAEGALDAGNRVEILTLRDKSIGFCKGCLSCVATNRCVIDDDASEIMLKIRNCDVLVFATPVYYYEMSGQLKTLIDRCNPNFTAEYRFRDVYLIAAAAESDRSAMDGAIKGIRGFVDCFERSALAGVIYGTGLTDVGDGEKADSVMNEAYLMGQSV